MVEFDLPAQLRSPSGVPRGLSGGSLTALRRRAAETPTARCVAVRTLPGRAWVALGAAAGRRCSTPAPPSPRRMRLNLYRCCPLGTFSGELWPRRPATAAIQALGAAVSGTEDEDANRAASSTRVLRRAGGFWGGPPLPDLRSDACRLALSMSSRVSIWSVGWRASWPAMRRRRWLGSSFRWRQPSFPWRSSTALTRQHWRKAEVAKELHASGVLPHDYAETLGLLNDARKVATYEGDEPDLGGRSLTEIASDVETAVELAEDRHTT